MKEILATFNSYNSYLQFTIEHEENNSINFLDMTLIKTEDKKIITNWYRKNTASGRYINYFSHHPQSQKIAIIYSLVDKSIKLSHPRFYNDNLKITSHYLQCNNFPLDIINKYIGIRLEHLRNDNNNNITTDNINISIVSKTKITLPYIKNLTPKINRILHSHNLIPINKTINKFN